MGTVSRYHLVALGIMIINSGPCFGWNVGLYAGLGSMIISTFLLGSAYFCLCLCTSELSSAFPFAGGSYGLARCTIGYYAGFIVGCFEIFSMILAISFASGYLALVVVTLAPDTESLRPLLIVLICAVGCAGNVFGKKFIWNASIVISIYSVVVTIIYCLSWLPKVNINTYSEIGRVSSAFDGSASNFMRYFPSVLILMVGDEVLNLCCDDAKRPTVDVPWAQMRVISYIILQTMVVVMVTGAAPPNIQHSAGLLSPVASGLALNLGISFKAACLLTVFPLISASTIGFNFAASKLISAMSESRLFPGAFSRKSTWDQPVVASISAAILSCLLSLTCLYNKKSLYVLQNMFLLCDFLYWIAQLVGFVRLRLAMTSVPRNFSSPLGVPGAVLAICVFLLGIVSIIGFQEGDSSPILSFVVFTVVFSIYYFVYASSRQRFSDDEKELLFAAHVKINENRDIVRNRVSSIKLQKVLPDYREMAEFSNLQNHSKLAPHSSLHIAMSEIPLSIVQEDHHEFRLDEGDLS